MKTIVNLLVILTSLITLDQAIHLAITNAIKVSGIAQLGKIAVGFSLLAFSPSLPELIVESAVAVAEFAGIPRTPIGATIIAFGISLPELTLGLKACLKGRPALALGNMIGSSFLNFDSRDHIFRSRAIGVIFNHEHACFSKPCHLFSNR